MKENFIHVCFVIDESGSMTSSRHDVVAGFKKVLDEQKANKDGSCAVSLYKFSDSVSKVYVGKDIYETKPLVAEGVAIWSFDHDSKMILNKTEDQSEATYWPNGCTAMYDGIGTAIDEIGQWLASMDEAERPSKNLIVIMTDGAENASHEYTEEKVREMIKHQEEKYNWSFVYMGTDITTSEHAERIGVKMRSYNTRESLSDAWNLVSSVACCYRKDASLFDSALSSSLTTMNERYERETGIRLD